MSNHYEKLAIEELNLWQAEMKRKPGLLSKMSSGLQRGMNRAIPEKVHKVITKAIKHTVQAMLKGSGWIAPKPIHNAGLEEREKKVKDRINFYKNTAAAEGAATGAGGFLLGLADFPLWLTLKMKMLTDIASLYGYDVKDFKERLYLLHIFQLAFSSKKHRREVYFLMNNWDANLSSLPDSPESFDWRTFQQEYRDYIDIAKLFQLLPGIGAFVGAYVNHNLTEKLGKTAINAYRMRHFNKRMLG